MKTLIGYILLIIGWIFYFNNQYTIASIIFIFLTFYFGIQSYKHYKQWKHSK